MPGLEASMPWRRVAAWSTALTVAAVLVMFAASGFWSEWPGYVALLGALAPAPLAFLIARRWLRGGAPFRAAAIGLALAALVQIWLAALTVEQFLITMDIRITNAPAESLYGLIVLFAPLYVGPPLLAGLAVGAVLRLITPAAGRHSPR